MRLLLVLGCVAVVLLSVEARDGQIEQCQCDSLMECRKKAKERETPCIEKCRRKLNHKNWNKEEGLKCFDQHSDNAHHQCMHAIALETCANQPGVMINRNETLHFGRRHHRKPRAIDTENDVNDEKHDEAEEHENEDSNHHVQHRPREHNKRAFYSFMRKHFGKSGKDFVKCMHSCGRHRHHDKCPKELKCGVKKLPQSEFHEKSAECHKKQTPRRFEICSCLKDAGMDRLDCTFGSSSPKTTTNQP